MDIVMFGQQNWDHCWTGKQQLAVRLAERGYRILYVDPLARTPDTLRQRAMAMFDVLRPSPCLHRLRPGLWRFQHVQPIVHPRLASRHLVMALNRALGALRMLNPVALTLNPRQHWLQQRIGARARIYYCVDEWTAFPGLTDDQKSRFRTAEESMLDDADLVLGVSPRLCLRFETRNAHVRLLTNGADVEHFAGARAASMREHAAIQPLPAPRIVYVGQVDERLDLNVVRALAHAFPRGSILLVGRVREGMELAPLQCLSNVHLLGYCPYDKLPAILRGADVCVAPYVLDDLTHACNPLKIYEYLATGLPIVSTAVEGLSECAEVIRVARSADEFVAAVREALDAPEQGREARVTLASQSTWDYRVDALERYLDEAVRIADRRPAPHRIRTMAGRAARTTLLRLDPKDDSEWQLNHHFDGAALTKRQRSLVAITTAAGRVHGWIRGLRRLALGRRFGDVERILVVRGGQLGDMVAIVPALRALRTRYPRAHIILGVKAQCPLVAPGLDLHVDEMRVLDFLTAPDRRARLAGIVSLWREGFDVVVSGVSYFLIREALFSGAPTRVGIYDGHPWQQFGSRILPLDPNRHEADNNLDLVRALGAETHDDDGAALNADDDAARAEASTVATALDIPDDVPWIAVHAGAARASRRWPAGRFADLLKRFLHTHERHRVLLTGAAHEDDLARQIVAHLDSSLVSRVHIAAGRTSMLALIGILDRSEVVVSNDTGVMHLARARNRPVLALLGPENDRRWGPSASSSAPAIALRNVVPCAPCVRESCQHHFCMRTLSVDDAWAALCTLMASPAQREVVVHRRHHTWHDLKEHGLEPPRVAVAILAGTDVDPEVLLPTVESACQNRYPNADVVIATDNRRLEERYPNLCVPLDAIHEHVAAEYITVLRPGERLAPGRVAQDVAALHRSPRAAAAIASEVFPSDRVHVALGRGMLTVRREHWPASLGVEPQMKPTQPRQSPAAASIAAVTHH